MAARFSPARRSGPGSRAGSTAEGKRGEPSRAEPLPPPSSEAAAAGLPALRAVIGRLALWLLDSGGTLNHVERTEREQGLLSIILFVVPERNCSPKT
nr:neuronal regeneration-related protein isoform X2 [Caretta caretta]